MRMYPIQDGPSVPYEVMVPHEAQCQKNHNQSIDRIAQRGGFGCSEAWCVVNGLDCDATTNHAEAKRLWIAYAERINLHYAEFKELAECLRQLHDLQNGCPLPKYEEAWTEIMDATERILDKVEPKIV